MTHRAIACLRGVKERCHSSSSATAQPAALTAGGQACRAASSASACGYGQETLASPPSIGSSCIQALVCNGHPGEGDRWQGSQPFNPARLLAYMEWSLVFTTVVPGHP